MTQPDLFTRSGSSIVPPTPQEVARYRRDRGMAVAASNADFVYPAWSEKALGYVRLHAMVERTFMAEQVRAMAEADGLPPPPTKRAWGPVMQKAAHAGIILPCGYAPANSSNGSPKVLWRSLVAA